MVAETGCQRAPLVSGMRTQSPKRLPVVTIRRDRVGAGRTAVTVSNGVKIAIFTVGGDFHALDDACLRCGASLGAGEQTAGLAICTDCGWVYDIVSGAVEGVPALRTGHYAVEVAGDNVRITLPARAPDTS